MTTLVELEREVALLKIKCRHLEQEVRQKDGEISELSRAFQSLKEEMKRSANVHSFPPTMALGALAVEFEASKKGPEDTMDECKQLLSKRNLMIQAKMPEVVKNQDFQMWTLEGLEEQMIRLRTSVNDLNQVLDNWRDSHIFHMQSIQHETFEGQNEIDLEVVKNEDFQMQVSESLEEQSVQHETFQDAYASYLEGQNEIYLQENSAATDSELHTVTCRVCGERFTLQHQCSVFSLCPSALGATNDSISLEQGSLALVVDDMISRGTFRARSSIVGGTSAVMGIQATNESVRNDSAEEIRSRDISFTSDDMLGANTSSHSRIQVEDYQQVSIMESIIVEPQGTPVDALMEREEIQIVLYWIMQRSGLNRNHLRALVAERLDRGEDCLIPSVLLDAVFKRF